MSKYVFAPAGPKELNNNCMRLAIEFIGSQQKGGGSAWSKGKRYLRNNLQCSGTAIKRACVVKDKYINHDFQKYDTRVYYYQIENCARIVEYTLDYIVQSQNKTGLPQALRDSDFHKLLEESYGHRISQIEWVRDVDYKDQRDNACIVCEQLNSLKKFHI